MGIPILQMVLFQPPINNSAMSFNVRSTWKVWIFLIPLSWSVISCGPPEEYETGIDLMSKGDYLGALNSFNTIDSTETDWIDSSRVRREECFDEIIESKNWALFHEACGTIADGQTVIDDMESKVVNSLLQVGMPDSMDFIYEILDDEESGMSEGLKNKISIEYMNRTFLGSYWVVSGSSVSGSKIYFKWAEKEGEEPKLNGYSANSRNGWSKNMLMYINVRYNKKGRYKLTPRTWRGGRSTFSRNWGSLQVIDEDKFRIYYGSISESVYFKRGDAYVSE